MSAAPTALVQIRELADRYGLPLETLCGRIALRPREVARSLGVSLTCVEGWIRSGKLATSRPDRIVLVPLADLLDFLERHRHVAAPRRAREGLRDRAAALLDGGRRVQGLG